MPHGDPILYKRVEIPEALTREGCIGERTVRYGGDIRIGDLTGSGTPDLLVYRSVHNAHDGGGMKPVFMGAFTLEGELLWQEGEGGEQPSRPGPVLVHDINQDGRAEVITFWRNPAVDAPENSLADVVLQIRDGRTGEVLREKAPPELTERSGHGANWVHQRILAADFRGLGHPRDFVVKLGTTVMAFDEHLDALWTHDNPYDRHGHCPSYIPAVGDIDQDGRDEVCGGYYLIDHDGTDLWEKVLGNHMDSVAIVPWDDGRVRAVCSGFGHVMDEDGNALIALGEEVVPHGQEVRVARFYAADPNPQMVIRYRGHSPHVMVVDTRGVIRQRFELNPSPNNTGMEPVYWDGPEQPARLYNGGMLWDVAKEEGIPLPGLPAPSGPRMGWHHGIAANVCGDAREEVVLYDPWSAEVFIYTPAPLDPAAYKGYAPGPRQYNPRLMD